MEPAPLYGDHPVCKAAICEFLKIDPLTHLRVAKWLGGTRGTIHIFNGRTEYIEKYYDVIARFIQNGYNVTAHDWRGQGLSTRNEDYPKRCHIMRFSEHQSDANAVMTYFSDMPGPHFLFCHSMGGAIGTRYMARNPNIKAAVLSAPMLGIHLPPVVEFFRPALMRFKKIMGLRWSTAPSTSDKNYELTVKFKKNLLTSHQPSWDHIKNLVTEYPDLQCGGPTYYWLEAAYKEMTNLSKVKKIKVPALVLMGTSEGVVSQKAIRNRIAIQDNWRLVELENGRHECYIENDEIQKKFWFNTELFLDQFS